MVGRRIYGLSLLFGFFIILFLPHASATGAINKINHVIIIILENRSFDNWTITITGIYGGDSMHAKSSGKSTLNVT